MTERDPGLRQGGEDREGTQGSDKKVRTERPMLPSTLTWHCPLVHSRASLDELQSP